MAVAKKELAKVNEIRVNGRRLKTFRGSRKATIGPAPEATARHGRTHYPQSAAEYEGDHEPLSPRPMPETPSTVDALKQEIAKLWNSDRVRRYELGEKLYALQQARGKPGHGTFIKELTEELGIPVWTAYRRIKYYLHVKDLWEHRKFSPLEPIHLLQNAQDAFDLVEDVQAAEEVELINKRDAEISLIEGVIEKNKEAVKKAAQRGFTPKFRLWVILPKRRERDKFRYAWERLGDKKASKLVYETVIREANKAKK